METTALQRDGRHDFDFLFGERYESGCRWEQAFSLDDGRT